MDQDDPGQLIAIPGDRFNERYCCIDLSRSGQKMEVIITHKKTVEMKIA
jgi:hypothetical protein